MYGDHFQRLNYHEAEQTYSQFPAANRILREKEQQKKRRKKRSNPNAVLLNLERIRSQNNEQTQNQFKFAQNCSSKISNNLGLIAKGIGDIAKFAMIMGIAFFSLQGILRKTEYLESDQSLIEGVGARIGGYVGDKYGASGRSLGHISEKGIKFIANEEGLRTEAYKDSKGVWTIGIGHTGQVDGKPITAGMKITEAKAKELFKKDIQKYENHVNQVVKVPVSQNMFDAMVSYAFNVGSLGKNFIRKINSGDYRGAMNELTTVDKELQNRRKREQALFGIDITSDNKLSGSVINPQIQTQDISTSTVTDFNDLTKVSEVKAGGGSAKTYDLKSNITSHTRLASGYNTYYNPNKKTVSGMGTFHGREITSGIGHRKTDGSSFHRGIDLAYNFESVKAFCSGTVTFAGVMSGFGRCVIINDSRGFRHVYGHLSNIGVSVGRYVKRGEVIGKSGRSGTDNLGRLIENRFPPHLHYGLWRPGGTSDKTAFVDPRTYIYPDETPQYTQSSMNSFKVEQNNSNLKQPTKKQNSYPSKDKVAKNNANNTVITAPSSKTASHPKLTNVGSNNLNKLGYEKAEIERKNRK